MPQTAIKLTCQRIEATGKASVRLQDFAGRPAVIHFVDEVLDAVRELD